MERAKLKSQWKCWGDALTRCEEGPCDCVISLKTQGATLREQASCHGRPQED